MIIRNGRVYRHDGDTDFPEVADILVEGSTIARVEPGLAGTSAAEGHEVVEAADRLVLPGFVNAHYHSHDTLLKGCFETIPLEVWVLSALPPAYPKRSREEVRARTLLGAAECLLSGMTTVQDMLTIFPFDRDHVDVVLETYEEIGIRVVFALQIGNIGGLQRVPYWRESIPEEYHRFLAAAVEPFGDLDPVAVVAAEEARLSGRSPRVDWALAPTSPEFCSPDFLERLADLSRRRNLPVYTHIYESKSMALAGRLFMPEHHGSQVRYLDSVGLLGPRMTMAHSVWMRPDEIELIAERGANVVLNPVGNLKTRSGVPPIRQYLEAGVNVAIGCDNSSCSDAQNMFQAMKMFTCLPAIAHVEPGRPTAADALYCATAGGARTAGKEDELGAIRPGMKADLTLLDLGTLAYVPLNSCARQTVYSEVGTAVDTVMVDGRILVRGGRLVSVSESEVRDAVEVVMPELRKDIDTVRARIDTLYPHLMAAWRRSMAQDLGTEHYIGVTARA